MRRERLNLRDAAVEIEPTPTDEERVAILAALERLLRGERDRRPCAWWAAGLPGAEDEP
jgi:hypothetical protein